MATLDRDIQATAQQPGATCCYGDGCRVASEIDKHALAGGVLRRMPTSWRARQRRECTQNCV